VKIAATSISLGFGLACLLGLAAESAAADTSFARIERGRHLVTAGDCIACHTAQGGKPFAGGRPIETPFGTIYSANITPDRKTGIGAWSDDDFYKALHRGIAPSGAHLYPAFPYPYFTRLRRDDVLAMRAYLNTIDPVKSQPRPPDLAWPLGYRFLMSGWNQLYFDEGDFHRAPDKSDEWNRGAYLVQGPAHCGACHTPKNFAGGDKTGHALQGGVIQGWFAPDITNDRRTGIGSWSGDEIVEYLKTGRNDRSGATGMMAEVVADSTSKLPDQDLRAIAAYLKDQKGEEPAQPESPSQVAMKAGAAVYSDSCSACHQMNGKGVPGMFSPLAGSASAQSTDPTTLIRLVLEGGRTVSTDARPTPSSMPAYGWKLTDEEIANVLTFVRNHWGNVAAPVEASKVGAIREKLQETSHASR
jgi:mono/diheme cytochrome c family protein